VLLARFNDDRSRALRILPAKRCGGALHRVHALEEGRLWTPEIVVPMAEIVGGSGECCRLYRCRQGTPGNGEAVYVCRRAGRDGIIAPVTQAFWRCMSRCGSRRMARYNLSFFQVEHDLYGHMRAGESDNEPSRLHRAHACREGGAPPYRRARIPQTFPVDGAHRRIDHFKE